MYQIHIHAFVKLIHHTLRRVSEHIQKVAVEGLECLHQDHSQVVELVKQILLSCRVYVLITFVNIILVVDILIL